MRRGIAGLCVLTALSLAAAGCGGGGSSSTASNASSTSDVAACTKGTLHLVTPGTLTIATGNPDYPPWYEGGTPNGGVIKGNDPRTGKGYESAVAYAIAKRLGFAKGDVKWIPVDFDLTYKPGPKNFDFAMQQISYNKQRAQAVDFSDSYYDVNQALVALKDSSIAHATTISDLKDAKLGVTVGTTSYDYVTNTIKPSSKPLVYDTLDANVAALKAGQIDGLVTDFPSAYYIANVQLSNATLVGRFPTVGTQEYFGVTFQKGNSLVACVNKAISALRGDGTLAGLEQQWITSKAHAPLIQQ